MCVWFSHRYADSSTPASTQPASSPSPAAAGPNPNVQHTEEFDYTSDLANAAAAAALNAKLVTAARQHNMVPSHHQDITQDSVTFLDELAAAAQQRNISSCATLAQQGTPVGVGGAAAASHSSGASDALKSLPAGFNAAPVPRHVARTSCSSVVPAAAEAVANSSMLRCRGPEPATDCAAEAEAADPQEQSVGDRATETSPVCIWPAPVNRVSSRWALVRR